MGMNLWTKTNKMGWSRGDVETWIDRRAERTKEVIPLGHNTKISERGSPLDWKTQDKTIVTTWVEHPK